MKLFSGLLIASTFLFSFISIAATKPNYAFQIAFVSPNSQGMIRAVPKRSTLVKFSKSLCPMDIYQWKPTEIGQFCLVNSEASSMMTYLIPFCDSQFDSQCRIPQGKVKVTGVQGSPTMNMARFYYNNGTAKPVMMVMSGAKVVTPGEGDSIMNGHSMGQGKRWMDTCLPGADYLSGYFENISEIPGTALGTSSALLTQLVSGRSGEIFAVCAF